MNDIRIVIFENEVVISRLSEVKTEDGNSLCLLMQYPFRLDTRIDDDGETQVSFTPWCIYTQDTEYRIPFAQVRSIGFPKKFLEEKYIEMVKPFCPEINATEDRYDDGTVFVKETKEENE